MPTSTTRWSRSSDRVTIDDLADRVRELYRCPERRAELARGSRNFVSRYSWEVVGREYVELVGSLGATSAAPRTA